MRIKYDNKNILVEHPQVKMDIAYKIDRKISEDLLTFEIKEIPCNKLSDKVEISLEMCRDVKNLFPDLNSIIYEIIDNELVAKKQSKLELIEKKEIENIIMRYC